MKLNLHILHIFSVLIIAHSIISYKLKEQKSSLQSCNFATHLVEAGTSILYFQQILGCSSVKTMMIYTHVSNKSNSWKQSTLDRLNLKTEDKNDKKNSKKV